MSFVEIENVSKQYSDVNPDGSAILSDIFLHVEEGEFMSLMGPSGSGKSTLLTILGAMNRPSRGKVTIDGIDIYELPEERRADFRKEYIGFVFQQHYLMGYLSAVENVMLPLATSKGSAAIKLELAMEVLDRVGLADKAARLPSQLSGGEQGRVAIARALVNDPPLLLADEPTGTLDSKTGEDIMGVFKRLNLQGQTIFMVTHNHDNAAMSDRLVRIRDGRLEQSLELGSTDLPSSLVVTKGA